MHHTIKALTSSLCLVLILSACKKDERSVSEWGQLAQAKLRQIEILSSDLPCQQQANVTIQDLSNGCSSKLYPILNSDLKTFENLKAEYFDLVGKQTDAMIKEGVIIDPCVDMLWNQEQPIRLECNNNKIQLITSYNISVDEAGPLAEDAYKQLMRHVDSEVCADNSGWDYTALVRDSPLRIQYIPFSRKGDVKELQKIASLYNGLKLRIINNSGEQPIYDSQPKRVKSVECVNGKPSILFAD